MRPEAAPPKVLRPKAAAPLERADAHGLPQNGDRLASMLRKVAAAPEAPARPEAASSAVLRPKARTRSAPDEFLFIDLI